MCHGAQYAGFLLSRGFLLLFVDQAYMLAGLERDGSSLTNNEHCGARSPYLCNPDSVDRAWLTGDGTSPVHAKIKVCGYLTGIYPGSYIRKRSKPGWRLKGISGGKRIR